MDASHRGKSVSFQPWSSMTKNTSTSDCAPSPPRANEPMTAANLMAGSSWISLAIVSMPPSVLSAIEPHRSGSAARARAASACARISGWRRRTTRRVRGRARPYNRPDAPVAQWIEQLTSDQQVGGSNPSGRASLLLTPQHVGV